MKPKRRQQVKKVWRIFRFKERFELPDSVRFDVESPLKYIREYVGNGQKDEAINYKRQITACKTSPNRHKLMAVFADLKDIAANYSRTFRGYILDERFEPASTSKIASWVGLNVTECDKILKELEKIGLIERVTMPEFDPSKDREKVGKRGRKKKSRARTRKPERARAPFKKDKAVSGRRSSRKRKNSGKPESDKTKKKSKSMAQAKVDTTAKVKAEGPTNPMGTDHRVGQKGNQPGNLPCRSIRIHYKKGPEKIGSVVQKLFRPPDCLVFAAEVYKAIGTPYPLDSIQGKSEIGCFESAWSEALLAGLNPVYLQELYDEMIAEAKRLRRKPRSKFTKSREAVLRDMFSKKLAAKKQKALVADSVPNSAKGTG